MRSDAFFTLALCCMGASVCLSVVAAFVDVIFNLALTVFAVLLGLFAPWLGRESAHLLTPDSRPLGSKDAGLFFQCMGCLIVVAGILRLNLSELNLDSDQDSYPLTEHFLLPVFVAIGYQAIFFGKRLIAGDSEYEKQKVDGKWFLYLRGFVDDRFLAVYKFGHRKSDEKQLARALEPIGPVMAPSNPMDAISLSGATRFKLPDSWRDEVQSLVSKCTGVILNPSISRNVQFEIDLLKRLKHPSQVLVWIPRNKKERENPSDYQELCDWLRSQCAIVIPKTLEKGQFIQFDRHWNAKFLPPARASFTERLGWLFSDERVEILRKELTPFLENIANCADQEPVRHTRRKGSD